MSLPRPTVLLVEDEALIALDVADLLESLHVDVVGPLPTCEAAFAWLGDHRPDVVVLDVDLKDGTCHGVARQLQKEGIPFLFYSGRSRRRDVPQDLQYVLWLDKPTHPAELVRAIAAMIRPTGRAEAVA